MAKGKFERTAQPVRVRQSPESGKATGNPFLALLNIVKTLLVWLVALVAAAVMIFTVVSVTMFDRSDRSLFGYRAFIVLSESMSATDFAAGAPLDALSRSSAA